MIKKIGIFITFILFLNSSLWAKEEILNYNATFGIFGTVGTIKNKLFKNTKTYKIETTVKLAGLAKMIMGGQTEHYISSGHIQNGLMISDNYTMTTYKKNQKKVKEYVINHQTKRVTKRYRKWIDNKLIRDEKQTLNFYAKDDLLTLYFNLGTAMKKKGKTYTFKAVGLEKQKGIVQIQVPSPSAQQSYIKELGAGAVLYAKALIHQKNFRKKKGDILIAVDKDGYIKKSVIKDILMYGDASLVRVK
jgi:hypothetical protein